MYLESYSPILSRIPWVPVVGNHEGFDGFNFYFNETDGENSAVDPAAADSALPHPMTTVLRTGTGVFGAASHNGVGGAVGGKGSAGGGSGTPRWFSLQIGLVHLVAVDSMVNFAAPGASNQSDPEAASMLAWLEADLNAIDRSVTPWIVVTAHFPMFCSGCLGGTPAGMPAALQPLFLKHGVDLFAAGHWH